jgi:hypothetical protein
MKAEEKIRQDFEAWWDNETKKVKANADAILRERMEAWLTEQNLTAEIDLTIDWNVDMQVVGLAQAPTTGEGP